MGLDTSIRPGTTTGVYRVRFVARLPLTTAHHAVRALLAGVGLTACRWEVPLTAHVALRDTHRAMPEESTTPNLVELWPS
jgi:hypothetical protein